MAEEKKSVKVPHSLILENRRALTATGVSNVDSFDEQTIVAYTDLGQLIIKGTKLQINKLNIETGELTLTGDISAMSYVENRISVGTPRRVFSGPVLYGHGGVCYLPACPGRQLRRSKVLYSGGGRNRLVPVLFDGRHGNLPCVPFDSENRPKVHYCSY